MVLTAQGVGLRPFLSAVRLGCCLPVGGEGDADAQLPFGVKDRDAVAAAPIR